MTNIVLPNSVTGIEDFTFSQCNGLTSVEIPSSVTSIGAYAFNSCHSLTSVEIPSSVTSIGRFAFYSCRALNKAEFASIEWLCGVAFENHASNPLYYAHNLYINGQEITEVRIPDSVTAIGNYAFDGCESITSLSIPNTVTSFGNGAFEGCSKLTTIVIPGSVTSIDELAFHACTGLTSVYYNTENPIDANSNVFQCINDGIYQNAFLYVPEAAVEKCKAVEPWSLFKNIKAYDFSGLEGIKADFNEDEPYEVYNLNGIKVVNDIESLEAGLYMVRQGANVKKIVVK